MQQPGLRKRMIIMLLFIGILFFIVFGFYFFKNTMMNKHLHAASLAPVTVSTIKVDYEPWDDKLTITGSTRAVRGVEVTSEVTGLIREIYFKPGQDVQKDDILVQLNADDEIAQLESLLATEALAEITFERDKAQYAVSGISKETLDTSEANLKSAMAQVVQQEAVVAKKTIRAPFAGKLGVSQINPGQYINPGDPMVTLQTLHPIYVDFYIPEQYLVDVTVGQTVNVRTDTYKDKLFSGEITTINPIVDVDTRNIEIEATLSNMAGDLIPGMFMRVEVVKGKPKQYITVPQAAINYNPYGDMVYLVEKQGDNIIAKQKFITVGPSRGDQVAVLEGLNPGDEVVTSGQLKLKNGSSIVINNQIEPSNNPHPKLVNE